MPFVQLIKTHLKDNKSTCFGMNKCRAISSTPERRTATRPSMMETKMGMALAAWCSSPGLAIHMHTHTQTHDMQGGDSWFKTTPYIKKTVIVRAQKKEEEQVNKFWIFKLFCQQKKRREITQKMPRIIFSAQVEGGLLLFCLRQPTYHC